MKSISIIAVYILCTLLSAHAQNSNGENDIAAILDQFPKSVVFENSSYSFDQTHLEDSLFQLLALYDSLIGDKTYAERDKERFKATIAYHIIAAGMFASPSPSIDELLTTALQKLRSEKLPNGVASPYTQMLGVISASFEAQNGGTSIDVLDLKVERFDHLISEAQQFISWRSKRADPSKK